MNFTTGKEDPRSKMQDPGKEKNTEIKNKNLPDLEGEYTWRNG